MGKVPLGDKEEFPDMENADFSDLQLIYHVRDTLVEVTLVNHFRNCHIFCSI